MTASALKQDPTKHIKGSKEPYLLGQNTTTQSVVLQLYRGD